MNGRRGRGYYHKNRRYAGIVGVEYKHIDTFQDKDINTADYNKANVWDPTIPGVLVSVATGTAENQRIGKKIWVKRLTVKGTIGGGSAAATVTGHSDNTYECWLVMDKQTNGTAMAAADFAEDDQTGVVFRNWEKSTRFTVLDHFKITTTARFTGMTATTAQWVESEESFVMSKTWPGSGLRINFSGVGDTIADIVDNSFHLVMAISSHFGNEYAAEGIFRTNTRMVYQG